MKNKKLFIITLGRVAQMAIMFITYRVLSIALSVEDMGIYYFLLSISAGFGLIFANPLGMYANRMLHSWQEHGVLNRNLKIFTGILLFGSILTIPFLFIFDEKLNVSLSSPWMVLSTLVFYVFSSSFNGTIVPALNLLGQYTRFVVLSFLTSLVGLGFSYYLVKIHPSQPLYWLIGQAIGFSIFALIGMFFIPKNNFQSGSQPSLKGESLERVWKFASPIVVTNLAVWILAQSFRFFYKGHVDSIQLGELAFGLGLATSLCVAVEYLFHQLFFPDFYKQISVPSADKAKAWSALFDKVMPSYIYVTFFMVGLSPFIMRILADIKFANAAKFLALGAFVEILRMTGNIFNMATQSEMKTDKAIIPYLSGGTFTIISILIISHQPQWVEWTPFVLMGGQFIAVILLWRNVQNILSLKISFGHLLSSVLFGGVFLSAIFLKNMSQSLTLSLVIAVVYGLYLLALLFKSYKAREVA